MPTLDHVWLAGTLTFAWLLGTLLPAGEPDYWWTVKLGAGLWATHQLPTADPLSFTATRQPYVEQQWLAQLVLAAVHAAGGLEAALVLRAAILALTAALLYYAARRVSTRPAAAVACLLSLCSVVGGAAIRPQIFALPLFALFLLGTTVWVERRWTLLALPLATVVWANVHGSFPLGTGLVAVALLGRVLALAGWRRPSASARSRSRGFLPASARLPRDTVVQRLAALLALCTLAPLANPYGLGIVPWLADYLALNLGGSGVAPLSQEWLPTSLATAHGALFLLSVILVLAALVRGGLPTPADALRLLAFGVLGLLAVRNTLWWAIVAAPVLAWGLSGGGRDAGLGVAQRARQPGSPAVNALLILGFVAVAALSLPWLWPYGLLFGPVRWPVEPPDLPVAAAEQVARTPATRLYNALDWGGYLAWRLVPRQRVFVDARFQLYPPRVYEDYFAIAQARPGWAARLAAYGIDGLVLSRAAQGDLVRVLAANDAWQAVYCDADAAVFLPRDRTGRPAVHCPIGP